jgi:nucleotide-binding universal stress UspA family protein
MFDNVLVGVGDQTGDDALALARRLVSAAGGLTLVQVQVVTHKPSASSGLVRETQEQQREMQALALRCEEAGVDARVASVKGLSVARGLHAYARLRDADLIVVGASRAGEIDHMLLGDNTRDVLRDAPCAVAVAPIGYADSAGSLEQIAIAYDGSPASDRAVEVARRVAAARDAKLSAFQAVAEPIAARDPWNPEPEIAAAVETATERIRSLGAVEPVVRSGDAAEELARFETSVDLLVIGAHEHRAIDRFFGVSSTSETLAEHPASPLLVLPPSAHAA